MSTGPESFQIGDVIAPREIPDYLHRIVEIRPTGDFVVIEERNPDRPSFILPHESTQREYRLKVRQLSF